MGRGRGGGGGGGGRVTIYVGRVIIFSNKIFGRVTIFLPKLREGQRFLIANSADLNVCPSNYPPTTCTVTGPST